MLAAIQAKNPDIKIYPVTDPAFREYGNVLTGFDFSECIKIMENRPVPAEGNTYTAKDPEMMQTELASVISEHFYASMPVEIGFCNGNGTKLNALEYHKGTEINVACTDLVLLLDSTKSIVGNSMPSSGVKAFYVPCGVAVELFGTTLHFAPCKLDDAGFKAIVVLPDGTNAALDRIPEPLCDEDKLLWMKNKWLIAHAESIPASKGAFVGITGKNIEIFY